MSDSEKENKSIITSDKNSDIYDNTIVSIWLKELAKRETKAVARLIGDNSKRLENIFGKPTFERTEKHDWHRVWIIDELGYPLIIFTGKVGTIYKINYPSGTQGFKADRKLGSQITNFLNKLIGRLSCSHHDGSGYGLSINVAKEERQTTRQQNTTS